MGGPGSMLNSAASASLFNSRAVGPGQPDTACLTAICSPRTASRGVLATAVYLVIERMIATASGLPQSPVIDWATGLGDIPPSLKSPIRITGEQLVIASIIPN